MQIVTVPSLTRATCILAPNSPVATDLPMAADRSGQTYELYSVPIYETGRPEFLTGKEIGSTKQQVSKGDILLCKINPLLNRVWEVIHHNSGL